jgi:hypothetical protein
VRRLMLLTTAGLYLCCNLRAQTTELQGPISGFVWDAVSKAVRALVGVPGGARVGAPVIAGVNTASIGPTGKSAIVWTGEDCVLLQFAPVGSSTMTTLGRVAEPTQIVWSQNGRTAILLHDNGELQRITIGSGTARIEPFASLSSVDSGATVLAVDATGENVVVSVRAAETAGLYRIRAGAAAQRLAVTLEPAATFADDGQLLVLDQDQKRIIRFSRDFFEIEQLAVPGLLRVAAAALSGETLLVASAEPNGIQFIDARTGEILRHVELESAPSALQPLFTSRPMYLLQRTVDTGAPAWLLDAGEEPSVWFIPAAEGIQ